MSGSLKRKRNEIDEASPSPREMLRSKVQPDLWQAASTGLRRPTSYEHSSTRMDGYARAHFGDVIHVTNAISNNKDLVPQESFNSSFIPWLAKTVSSVWQRRAKANELQSRLGEWVIEARSPSGECLIPVLSRVAFEKHLVDHDAEFRPSTPCTSTFAWAQLLHVFDIHPGQGIVIWRRAKPEEDPLHSGSINLDLDGQSVCHMFNLYSQTFLSDRSRLSMTLGPSPDWDFVSMLADGKIFESETNSGSFATNINSTDSMTTFCYEARLSATPYGMIPLGRLGRRSLDNSLMALYLRTLHQGTSDDSLVLLSPTEPLEHRVQALLQVKKLSYENGVPMVTDSWLSQASRIKRRVTTNGGTDHLLQECLTDALAKNEIVMAAARKDREIWARENHIRHSQFVAIDDKPLTQSPPLCPTDAESIARSVRRIVSQLLMYEGMEFEVPWDTMRRSNRRVPCVVPAIRSQMTEVIKGLKTTMEGTWVANLSDMAADVQTILYLTSELPFVRGLPINPSCWLWEARCRVLG